MIHKTIQDGRFILRTATPADTSQMEEVQGICFPTLAAHERLTQQHFANHIRVFPEGQLVVTDHDRVVASSSTLRVPFPALDHTFMEITDHLWITNTHMTAGEWLYQLDIGILPAYRGLKLSTELYNAQQELVATLCMKGQVLVGMTIGYERYKDRYSIEEYCEKLKTNELTDPTVTPQRRAGFQWIQPIFNYLEDPTAGNCSILMARPLEGVSLQEAIAQRLNASSKNG